MKAVKYIFLALGLIVILSLIIYVGREFLPSKPEKRIVPELEKVEREKIELPTSTVETTTEIGTTTQNVLTPTQFFDLPISFVKIDYPYLYAYDLNSKTIREYDLESKTYKELYKNPDINFVSYSKDFNKIVIKEKNNFYYLDLLKDKKISLPYNTERVLWKDFDLYLYLMGSPPYIAKLEDNEIKKLFNIYIFNLDMDSLNNGLVVYERDRKSPIILIKENGDREFLFDETDNISLITNKNDLIFFSSLKNRWKSYLINNKGEKLAEFNFGTLKEKCDFKDILVCGVPLNQNIENYYDWYNLKLNFVDKLIFYNPTKNEIKSINLTNKFDVINPQLTSAGLFFINRYDSRLYFIPQKNLPF
ncbi:MAG: hypothetical protein ACP5JU_00770 [Minisyncoccia bacterium]